MNVDDLRDLWTEISKFGSEGAEIHVGPAGGPGRDAGADVDTLMRLTPYDRRRIELVGKQQCSAPESSGELFSMATITIEFQSRGPSFVLADGYRDVAQNTAQHCVDALMHSASSGVTSDRLRSYARAAMVAVVLAVVIWACAVNWTDETVPLLALLTLTSLTCAVTIARRTLGTSWFRSWANRRDGVQLDPVSRAARRERRLNNRDNLRYTLIGATVPIVIAVASGFVGLVHF